MLLAENAWIHQNERFKFMELNVRYEPGIVDVRCEPLL
jgi:hypothetical protein